MTQDNAIVDATELERARAKYRLERDKRIDPARHDIVDLTEHPEYLEDPYTGVVEREPVTDAVDAVVVGAGFGGLLAALHLKKQGLARVRLVEKAGDVGGVWYWNRYPGAMCDVESYVYLPMLEELGYIPRHRYSYAPEIFEHARRIARHFDLYGLALFHTAVTGMTWEPATGTWQVRTSRGDRIAARYVVVAHGSFGSLKLPAIPGIDGFKGAMFHTSRWDYEYTGGDSQSPLDKLGDKTVGIIGTGASAVQVVPAVARAAQQLYVFQRTPSTVGVRDNTETDPVWAASLRPGWQRRRRENFTRITNGEAVGEDLVRDAWTTFFHAMLNEVDLGELTPEQRSGRRELIDLQHMENIRARITQEVHDPAVAEALKPYYRYQCKRPCFHDDYLPAFNRPNVHLVDTNGRGVERVTASAVVVGGEEYPVDCLILATGFDQESTYVSRIGFDVVGPHGEVLSQKWADGPETLHGVMTAGFPNFFFQPTNYMQGTAGVNFVHTLEENAVHIAAIIGEFERRGVYGSPARSAEQEYVARVTSGEGLALIGDGRRFLQECTPGRWNNEGDPDAQPSKAVNHPGTSTLYFAMLKRWRDDGDLLGLELTPVPDTEALS
ncbi:flavin-containing monooxygenase [Pseudofrankia inefficax]|uniref:Flavin-containing monooxygenase-like protein n=1 Tax=Pseudofrankia inefficax (strain DSM 45817 / CECT 9037 / DDB 130130 / EuI1c) TaxID=298654 RepID=E3IV95_PSEI1|nr:NAD(P)/FAD-dependent oxidoreductase [Pseudofrankia inefficax]ADP81259.1 Flavin-containing monooxygenase-like protein [Pseudofrankia inefficax]